MKQLLVIFFAVLASLDAHARKYDDVIESGFIRIAVYRNFPPYSYRDQGKPAGIDIEVGRRLARALGVRPQWFWLTADENLEDDLRNAVWKGHYLGGGVADVMLRVPYDKAFAHMTDEFGEMKNDLVVLLGPYHRERWTIARNTQQLPGLPNLFPLQYHKIGVEVDSAPDFLLSSALGGRLVNNLIHYTTTHDAIDALTHNKVTAVAGMRGAIEWRLAQTTGNSEKNGSQQTSGQIADITLSDDSIIQWPRRAWDIGMAIKHSYRQLGYALEAEIERMVNNGEMASIFQQYHMSYELPDLYLSE